MRRGYPSKTSRAGPPARHRLRAEVPREWTYVLAERRLERKRAASADTIRSTDAAVDISETDQTAQFAEAAARRVKIGFEGRMGHNFEPGIRLVPGAVGQ